MIEKYFGGTLPADRKADVLDDSLVSLCNDLRQNVSRNMDKLNLPGALADIFGVVSRANKYIDETTPWILGKDKENHPRLATVMYNLCEALRICSILLYPFMPATAPIIQQTVGASPEICALEDTVFGKLPPTLTVQKTDQLFPRIDLEKELAALDTASAQPELPAIEHEAQIDYAAFMKTELRVCEVRSCEKVEKADKLLRFTLFDGERERVIVSGIAKDYPDPGFFVGKKVAVVLNLAPAKIRGIVSEGMILSSDLNGDGARTILIDKDVPVGARIR
jgi:methionyl-tRNA synthetase